MNALGEVAPLGQRAVGRGVLHEHTEAVVLVDQVGDAADPHLDAQRLGPGLEHFERLRVAAVIG